ncbi:MAG: single-stranded-DNA-specific exonuclease RecJ, partial [Rhizomicrobium sp.]
CDVVPLNGVNRAFVRQGLAQLSRLARPGLLALAQVAGVTPPFSTYHLGFVFGPRINAGGRVGRSGLGADLLSTNDESLAGEFARQLDRHNRERREIERAILDEATAQAALQDNSPFLLVTNEGWHAGVVGIVAGRLKERFAKPAFVAGFEGGMGRGSARSIPGLDAGRLVRAAREQGLIEAGGGHAMAAGFTLAEGQLSSFRQFLERQFASGLDGACEAAGDLAVDAVSSPGAACPDLVSEIARAGPYGAGNPEPLLAFPNLRVAFAGKVGDSHVKMRLVGGDGGTLDAIAFRAAGTALGDSLLKSRGRLLHVAGRLKCEEWNGARRVQLQIEDAASASP